MTDREWINKMEALLRKHGREDIWEEFREKNFPLKVASEGELTGYKMAVTQDLGQLVIVELRIPSHAKRSSGYTNKCRASEAKVINIYTTSRDEWKGGDEVVSLYGYGRYDRKLSVTYKVGETVYPDDWDEDRWTDCSHGIHFFRTFDEAVEYIAKIMLAAP